MNERLKRLRRRDTISGALFSKGHALLRADSASAREAGIAMLGRVISDFPDDDYYLGSSHLYLGQIYAANGQPRLARIHLIESLRISREPNSILGSAIPILELALLSVRYRMSELYEASIGDLVNSGQYYVFPDLRFSYLSCLAILMDHTGNVQMAASLANDALSMAHLSVGTDFKKHVYTATDLLGELQVIVDRSR